MKKLTLLFAVLFAGFCINAQNVAINNDGTSAASSAMLDVKSTTKGFMMPRVSSAQRTTISSPVLGLLVFDTDTKTIWAYDGSSWKNLYTSGGGLSLPFSQTVNLVGNTMMIRNNSTGAGLLLYANNGVGLNVTSANSFGIRATSWTSNAIHAYTDNPNNTIPTIRANNFGGGKGLYANSSADDGVYGATSATSKAGIRGEGTTGGSYGVMGNNNIYGKADLGIGVQGVSQSGTGMLAYSGTGNALEVNGKLKIAGGNTNPGAGKVLTSDADGNATWQQTSKIGFRAQRSNLTFNSFPSGDNWYKVIFSGESYDFGNNFTSYAGTLPFANASLFTVPVNGVYNLGTNLLVLVNGALLEDDFAAGIRFGIIRNGNTFYTEEESPSYTYDIDSDPDQIIIHIKTSNELYLHAGDQVFVQLKHRNSEDAAAIVANYPETYFHGRLVIAD